MDFKTDRNPSPPPEILSNEDLLPDRVGDSIYSKKWLYQTLMSIMQFCDKPPREVTNIDGEATADMIELDPKIEEDACTLWDMSASKDVADFLVEVGVPAIILDIVEKTQSPRLLEIAIGILGNLSHFSSICATISKNEKLLCSILHISGTSDTPTLIQVFRVILCGVRNPESQSLWFQAIDENSIFFDNLKFIFENSLSCDVVTGSYQVLQSILTENAHYCKIWGEQPFLNSIIEAAKQPLKMAESLGNFFCVLNALCQYTPNVEKLVDYWTELDILFKHYFENINEEEPLPETKNVSAIFSCFDTYNSIIKSPKMKRELVTIDINVLSCMCQLAVSVNSMVSDMKKDNVEVIDKEHPPNGLEEIFLRRYEERQGTRHTTLMDMHEFQSWVMLGEAVVETGKALMSYAEKEAEKELLEKIINSEEIRDNIDVLII